GGDFSSNRSGAAQCRQRGSGSESQRSSYGADRHRRRGVPRADDWLRTLPQSQARSNFAEGLLPLAGLPRSQPGRQHLARFRRTVGAMGTREQSPERGNQKAAENRAESRGRSKDSNRNSN